MTSNEKCYEQDRGWLIIKKLLFVIFLFIYDGVISYIKNLYLINKDKLFLYFYNNKVTYDPYKHDIVIK